MTTTFDQYLLRRFLFVFCVLFVSTFGLFVVIDGFTNIDSFSQGHESTSEVMKKMGTYYLYHASVFFEMVGPIIATMAVMVVFALLQRQSEIHPILAAGIPTYRLVIPFLIGTVLVNGMLIVNQEIIIPRHAHHLQAPRHESGKRGQKVEPVYDYATFIHIDGKEIFLGKNRMEEAKFVLPAPEIAHELTTIKAKEAFYQAPSGTEPSGWLLKEVSPGFRELNLTPDGARVVRATDHPNELFVVTDVSFDQLYNRGRSYQYLSTPELIRRIQNPASGILSVRGQSLHLHTRLTRPVMSLVCVMITVPLIVRKESRGLVGSIALCTIVLGVVFGVSQLFLYLGKANMISPDLTAWGPVIFGGSLGAWLTGYVQT